MTEARKALRDFSNAELRRRHSDAGWRGDLKEAEKCHRALARRDQIDPCGKPFPWGTVTCWHRVGEYVIAESWRDHEVYSGKKGVLPPDESVVAFHPYVDDMDTGHSFSSLDAALVHCVAFKHDPAGPNTRADLYFMRMIGAKKVEARKRPT